MAASNDPVNFDIIETQKENIQSLPGGRSAKELARIFSPGGKGDLLPTPSPNETKTVNDAIRQEYETELQAIGESDDPLDIYDRYVKWTLNAYPSAQATPESGLLPLLERATKAFLSSSHYKNDPRYLRLWLHYIRLFSDSPREVFAFLARHQVGEGLALFYEEFAAWLESAGRWAQAEEVYMLGIQREARPVERLARKFGEFQKRYEQRTQDAGPSSPALPAVRPALAAKIDPFASSASSSTNPQASQAAPAASSSQKTRSGKPKMAIFSDADAASPGQPAIADQKKGWDSIGSLSERRKENRIEAKPWVGETLKVAKKAGPSEKLTIFRDQSNENLQSNEALHPQSMQVPDHRVREAINPRTGRRERVFVNLEAVYPDYMNSNNEMSFEELRALSRGWMQKDWRSTKVPLKQVSGNIPSAVSQPTKGIENSHVKELPVPVNPKSVSDEGCEGKSGRPRKMKVLEVRGETQTIKMNFDSPTKPKIRRKSTSEPTMTFHTRAATDEIYSIFNQPLKAETEDAVDSLCGSDYEDDDCTSVGESTVTGHVSATSSDFGDEEMTTFHRQIMEHEDERSYDDTTRAESVAGSEWTQFTNSDIPPAVSGELTTSPVAVDNFSNEKPERQRFVPEMPEDYDPPSGPYRDPAIVAQNRLPFMTPIVEQTEYSLASMTAARNSIYNAKTPSKLMPINSQTPPGVPHIEDLLLSSPVLGGISEEDDNFTRYTEDISQSPTLKKSRSPRSIFSPEHRKQAQAIIQDLQCNPTDRRIRETIITALDPPLTSYRGYHDHADEAGSHAGEIQRFVKAMSKRPKSGESFQPPILDLKGAERSYALRRELGAGAYAPVYLVESVDSPDSYSSSDEEESENSTRNNRDSHHTIHRHAFEAIKMEIGPPNAWEFYMIRAAHQRLKQRPELSRAADSIIRVHELHVFKGESFLVEDYRGQGTLLDLANVVHNGNAEGGMEEALAMFFTVELFRTIEALHACSIIHGDIKADNCLVRFDENSTGSGVPSLVDLDDSEGFPDPNEIHYSPRGACGWRNKGLALIDFGRAIDMRAFKPAVQFIADWKTKDHECNEIREMRPWTHQIDLYGLAGTVHVMLFGKYMETMPVRASGNSHDSTKRTYRIRESFKRYWDRELWSDVFDLLLNPGCERWVQMEREGDASVDENTVPQASTVLPVLNSMRHVRERMEAWLVANAEKKSLSLQIRKLEAIFAERKKKLER